MTVVFSAQNRDSSSLRVGAAEQCCQQDLTSTPSSNFPVPVSVLHRAPYCQKTWKRKKKVFSPLEFPMPAQPAQWRRQAHVRMCHTGRTETVAASIQFRLKSCRAPPVYSNKLKKPLNRKRCTAPSITGTATGTSCTVISQQI